MSLANDELWNGLEHHDVNVWEDGAGQWMWCIHGTDILPRKDGDAPTRDEAIRDMLMEIVRRCEAERERALKLLEVLR